MNVQLDPADLATMKFGVGQSVPRAEDPTLIRGEGQYTDDVSIEGQAYLAMVRSPQAHGVLRGVDMTTAKSMPGVLAVYTGAELLAAGYKPQTCRLSVNNADGTPMRKTFRHALAVDKVRFVGDPVACVVARTEIEARDAAEAVTLDIEVLDCVVDSRDGAAPGAPQLYDDIPNNVSVDFRSGDAAAVAQAFSRAAHVTRLHLINNRIVVNPMEVRSVVAQYDAADERFIMHIPTQGVLGSRAAVADVLGVAHHKVRILARNVGGSFGMKPAIFPEYICAAHAARDLGVPVKWTDTRSDSFLSDHHGRDHEFSLELALDADGKFLAVRADGTANLGAYLTGFGPLIPTVNVSKHLASCYRTPLIEVHTRGVLTNTVPTTAYRGAGRPEGNYYLERLIDTAAREMKIDAADLRRRNHIQPDQMPYKAASGATYDSGEFTAILNEALQEADWDGFDARLAASAARGLWRGRGIGQFLEVTAPPAKELGAIRFDADGGVTLSTGTHDHGQGHLTSFAQIVSERLGVPFSSIRLVQTDSDVISAGGGTGGSKSLMASGTAFYEASDLVLDKARHAAAHFLEASTSDIEFVDGSFAIAGTDRRIGVLDIARRLAGGGDWPAEVPSSLDVSHVHESSPSTFPNGCHIAEVEIDPETGHVSVARYTSVNDFGTLVNPMIVEGQIQGGVVQGIGQCLMERTVYSADGQLTSGSFVDYAMPRAEDAPQVRFFSHPVPARTNPLGVKGCGEAGCAGAMTSVMNALTDALARHGVPALDMPATPAIVFAALRAAGAA
ncbi:MAG: xanthine dehydrogenase family protein molybdopterin-binding subunit [Beijerinckiaceae bacterium]|nr:xanthine dehydrogenase family protein molybdopterin-binding subunit [Beijerinckiaceae bacterium]